MKNLLTFKDFVNENINESRVFTINELRLKALTTLKGLGIRVPSEKQIMSFVENLKSLIKDERLGIVTEGETESFNESHYAFLGGNSNFSDDEMRKNVVDKFLGKRYDSYIMFDGPKGEYDKIKDKYAKNSDKWETIWRSSSYQTRASISPDKKVIKAEVFSKGGIVGAIYVKK